MRFRKIISLIPVICIICAVTQRVCAAPSLEDYGLLPEIQHMSVSPDGDRIAYRRVTENEDYIAVISLSKRKTLSKLDVSEVKPMELWFANNDQIFLRASEFKRLERFRGKLDVSTGMTMSADGNNLRQLLVPGDGIVYPGQTGLGNVVGTSPDGTHLYMPAYYGDVTYLLGDAVEPNYSLLRVRLAGRGKAKAKLHKGGTKYSLDFFVNGEGEVVAEEVFNDDKDEHIIYSYLNKKKEKVFENITALRVHNFVGLTMDEQHLVMLNSEKTGRTSFYKLSLKDATVSGPFHERSDADIEKAYKDMQRKVFGIRYSGFKPSYKFFDKKLDERVKKILDFFPGHSVWVSKVSPDRKQIVVYVEGPQAAGDYYLFSEGKEPAFLATSYKNIAVEDIHPNGTVTMTARDGLKIPILLTIPQDKVSDMKNLPTVILPHGGPSSHDSIGFDYEAQALAQQGYLVVHPQFRGSDGFGHDFEVAGYGEWGGKMQDDITDALSFLVKKGIVNGDRVCIVGGSYGGFAALAGGAFTPELYKCVVSINGISNLRAFRGWVSRERGHSSNALAYWDTQIGGDDEYAADEARARSPKFAADAFQAPVLLIHAKNDKIVPISQSKEMYSALKKADKPVNFVELKGDDHHLSKGKSRLEALKAMVDFVNKNI